MKKILISLSIIVLSLLCSCNFSGNKSGETVAASSNQMEEANSIIEYYNNSLKVLRETYKDKDMENILSYMEKNGKTHIAPIIVNVSLRDTTKVQNPGKGFSKSQRDSLITLYKDYTLAGNKFFDNYDKYKAYLKAEDYKDDNWEKGKSIYNENIELYNHIHAISGEIFSIISPMADKAEEITLVGNPWKDHILTGKAMFNVMGEIIGEYEEEKVEPAAIETSYNRLEELINRAKGLEGVKDEDSKNKRYTEFVERVETFLGEVRKQKRENKFTESGYKTLNREYEYAIRRYNSFVN